MLPSIVSQQVADSVAAFLRAVPDEQPSVQ